MDTDSDLILTICSFVLWSYVAPSSQVFIFIIISYHLLHTPHINVLPYQVFQQRHHCHDIQSCESLRNFPYQFIFFFQFVKHNFKMLPLFKLPLYLFYFSHYLVQGNRWQSFSRFYISSNSTRDCLLFLRQYKQRNQNERCLILW